jgi:hypothetical protein
VKTVTANSAGGACRAEASAASVVMGLESP